MANLSFLTPQPVTRIRWKPPVHTILRAPARHSTYRNQQSCRERQSIRVLKRSSSFHYRRSWGCRHDKVMETREERHQRSSNCLPLPWATADFPHIGIVPQKVSENPAKKQGVEDLLRKSSPLRGLKTSQGFKGMFPLGCLPTGEPAVSERKELAGEEPEEFR